MRRRLFIKSALAASTALATTIGTSLPSMAGSTKSGSYTLDGYKINIKVEDRGDHYVGIFNEPGAMRAVRARMTKGNIKSFAGLGQKDGQILMVGKTKVMFKGGLMLITGADGSVTKHPTPPVKNVGPAGVIILIIIIIYSKWPPKPKLVRMNGAEMEVGY